MKVLHIISSLDVGGAEKALVNLLAVEPERSRHRVVSLTGWGPVADQLVELGVTTSAINCRDLWRFVPGVTSLVRAIRAEPPDLVQTWMYHADIIGGLATRLALRRLPLVWGVRLTEVAPAGLRTSTRRLVRIGGLLSRWLPDAIIVNAAQSVASHVAYGYDPALFHVVANGFDTQRFRPDAGRRAKLRGSLGLHDGQPLLGLVGRYSTQKDQDGFIAMAGKVASAVPDAHFLLCGRGIAETSGRPSMLRRQHGLDDRLHLLPERQEVENVYAGLDLYVSTSRSEGFPNVVAEAMASGLPCVVTDVGNCRELVDRTGRVCPPGDPEALAAAVLDLLALPPAERSRLGAAARQRIVEHYSRERMLQGFHAVWEQVRADTARAAAPA